MGSPVTLASASMSAPEQRQREAVKARETALLFGCWAIVAGSSLAASFGKLPDGLSTDDAMRLVSVRDFLAGQPWFDLTQYRLGPSGSPMHWSRLVDLPIALILKLLQLFAEPPTAERLTMAIWPSLVLLPALAGMRALGRALHGAAAGNLAVVLGVLLVPLIGHFRPGALDHHNVQIALLLWAAAWIVRYTRHDAIRAACAMGVSLAIGLEMLPAIAVLATCAGARWIAEGDRIKPESIAFGLSLAGATGILLVATVPPARWFVVTCDALSVAHLAAAAAGGAGLAWLAAACSARSVAVRLAGATGVGICVAAAVALIAPECLANPYAAVHPRLQEFWLANVAETQSLLVTLTRKPVDAIALYLPPLAALLLSALAAAKARGDTAWRWATAAALQAVLLSVAVWELRAAAAANAIATALIAASLTRFLPPRDNASRVFGQRPALLVAAFVLTPLLLVTGGNSLARAARWLNGAPQPDQVSSRAHCHDASSFSTLAGLPAGRVLAFIDSGAFILMQTPHAVLAAPYHRNNDGNLAAVDAFLAPPAEAQAGLLQNRVDYVVVCNGAPELKLYRRAADGGLAAQLAMGNVPAFLQPVALGDGPLRAWRFIGAK